MSGDEGKGGAAGGRPGEEGAGVDLKPCPLCGGEVGIMPVEGDSIFSPLVYFKCRGCGSVTVVGGRDKAAAVHRWNRRARPAGAPALGDGAARAELLERAEDLERAIRYECGPRAGCLLPYVGRIREACGEEAGA